MNKKLQNVALILLSVISLLATTNADARFRFRFTPHYEAPRFSGYSSNTFGSLGRELQAHSSIGAAVRASGFVPHEVTVKPEHAVSYLEKTDEGFFFKSNYAPTAGSAIKTEFRRLDAEAVAKLLKNAKGEIVVDESVFTSNGAPTVDLSGAKRIKVVRSLDQKVLMDSSVDFLPRSEPPPLAISKIEGCCLYGIPPYLTTIYKASLHAKRFAPGNVRFVSLVQDSATEAAIRGSPTLRTLRGAKTTPASIAELEATFQRSQGKTLILMGHVENRAFVVRDAQGDALLQIPIESVRSMARKHKVDLIDLGCETAKSINQQTLGVGVMTRFNTVEAVRAIELAVSESNNYADFFAKLTQRGLKIVIDKQFIDGRSLKADIYSRIKNSAQSVWVKVASAFVTFSNGV